MAEIRVSYHNDSPSWEGFYWHAVAVIDGSVHTDASAVTVEAALASLAKNLVNAIEDLERGPIDLPPAPRVERAGMRHD